MNYCITPIPAFKDNYIWCVENPSTRTCLVIDPGESAPVIKHLTRHQLTPEAILITHHHRDHCGGTPPLLEKYSVPVYGALHASLPFVDHITHESDTLNFPRTEISLRVLDIPGHVLDHIAFYNDAILFSGDTLFAAGCGRLFEGTPAMMCHSLNKLAALPKSTRVYCGHEYTLNNLSFARTVEPSNPHIQQRLQQVEALRAQQQPTLPSTIQLEKQTNPFLRCSEKEIIDNAEKAAQSPLKNPVEVFSVIRQLKDRF